MSLTVPLKNGYNVLVKQPKIVVPIVVFSILIGVIGAVIGVLIVASAFAGVHGTPSISNIISAVVPVFVLVLLLGLIGGALLSGMYISIAAQSLKGRVLLNTAWNVAKGKFIQLAILSVMVAVIYIVIIGILALVTGLPGSIGALIQLFQNSIAASSSGSMPGISAFIPLIFGFLRFFLLLFIISLILGVLLYMSPVLVVIENRSAIDALVKSIDLGKKKFLTILAFHIVVGIITGVVIFVVAAFSLAVPIIGWLIRLILDLFFGAWAAVLPTLFYFEYFSGKKK